MPLLDIAFMVMEFWLERSHSITVQNEHYFTLSVIKFKQQCFDLEVERVAILQNRAGSGYLKNSRTGPGRAGYTRPVEKLDNDQCSKH